MKGLPNHPIDVLLVEDNPGDVGLVREGLRGSPLAHRLHVAATASRALSFLRREGEDHDAPRPDMVILDLNLQGSRGHVVLAEIKADPALRTIPVCILSSSSDPRDVRAAYDAHANAYVTKPMELEEFLTAVREIERFWFATAALPERNSA